MASIEKRGKGWRITVKRHENGKQVKYRKLITGDLKPKDLEKIAREYEVEIDQGKHTSVMMGATVGQFAQEWYTHHVKTELATSTREEYQGKLNKYILPALGGIRIRDLRPQEIIKFLQKLSDDKVGARTQKFCYQIISSMCTSAVYWSVLPLNPCDSVKPPKYTAPEAAFYDAEQAGKLLAALENVPDRWLAYRLGVTLSLFSTLRRSEVLGLRRIDVDFNKCTLTVAQSLRWAKGTGFTIEPTKTLKSARTVNLGPYSMALLERYLDMKDNERNRVIEVGSKHNVDELIFTDPFGNPIRPYLISGWFSRFVGLNGLPPLSFHGLRHTAVTNMIAGGFDLITAGDIAGHAQKSTTANIYAHAIENNKKAASTALEINLMARKNG